MCLAERQLEGDQVHTCGRHVGDGETLANGIRYRQGGIKPNADHDGDVGDPFLYTAWNTAWRRIDKEEVPGVPHAHVEVIGWGMRVWWVPTEIVCQFSKGMCGTAGVCLSVEEIRPLRMFQCNVLHSLDGQVGTKSHYDGREA